MPEEERSALLRALHTLKGNSGMLGFAAIRDSVHVVEDAFKAKPASWAPALLDALFESAAALRKAVEAAGTEGELAAFERLTADSARLQGAGRAAERSTTPAPPLPVEPASAPAAAPAEPPPTEREPRPARSESGEASTATEVLRIPFTKLDSLLNRVAELFGVQTALTDLLTAEREALEAAGLRRVLEERVEQLERVADALRDSAMDLRLVPIGRVLSRFPSLVRDLARQQGKRIRVVLEGEETELDKSTVDALGEPLLHLVKNAVDHGIATPDVREARGKPAEGTITLRAWQSGDSVCVEVEDDGSGLDREQIIARAGMLGYLAAGDEPSAEEIADLIFRPGFSTRSVADAVSGRGIGLDVVASSVGRLRGSLDVEDRPGAGTRFVLRLPLTLAIVPALIFEVAEERLALPALEVEDALRPSGVSWAGDAEVVRYGDELLPLARLPRLFGWPAAGERSEATSAGRPPSYVVVVRRGARAAGVAADRLLDQRDVVVKALPAFLGQPLGVSGAAIAPDGRVIWMLDPGGLIDLNLNSHRRAEREG